MAFPDVMARTYLGWARANRGAFETAIACAGDAVRAAEGVGHPESVAMACAYLALVHTVKGDVGKAIGLLERSVALCHRWKLSFFTALATAFLGHAQACAGRVADGIGLLEDALPRFESMRVGAYHASMLVQLTEACALAGRLDDGLAHARRALTLARERGERGTEAWALRALGELTALRDPSGPEAAEHHRRALDLARELGMRPLAAHCHLGLGTFLARTGRAPEGRAELTAAADLYRAMAMDSWLRRARTRLAAVA